MPHTAPQTSADMISMKLKEKRCTSVYIITPAIIAQKRLSRGIPFHLRGVHEMHSPYLRCTYARQKISSAGPMMKRSANVSSQGLNPSFIPYIESTCARANEGNNHWLSLSPTQNIPQRAIAMPMPRSTFSTI